MSKRYFVRALMLATVVVVFVAVASPAWAADFTVTNTDDSGDGSLRKAITDANASAGLDTIKFDIPGEGPHKISPESALPRIDDAVIMDGYTQDGASLATTDEAASLKIEVEGSEGIESGIVVGPDGGGSTVRGLAINGFSKYGIHLLSDGNTVEGNHIGTDVAGEVGQANGSAGILVDGSLENAGGSSENAIGGTDAGSRNVISGNGLHGVWIFGTFEQTESASGNEVLGNYIGTDASGAERLANGDPGEGFGGSGSGVQITLASGNTIGGTTPGARNLLSGNGQYGINITSASSNNEVQGNYIGADKNGTDSITNETDGVRISGGSTGNTIGGTQTGAGNVISGNNSITSFSAQPNSGVTIRDATTTGNKVQGNYIGPDKDGEAPLGNSERNDELGDFYTGNGQYGVRIQDSSDNIIGGTEPGARNVISGNKGLTQRNGVTGTGLFVYGPNATGNEVQGNYIGTDKDGVEEMMNVLDGVVLEDAPGNTIGGTATGARNVISGNQYFGLLIRGEQASGNEVQGNYIGVDATGTEALPNATGEGIPGQGVIIYEAPGNTIGGTQEGAGNVISGNVGSGDVEGGNGIAIIEETNPGSASGNVVQGNLVGTDATGTKDLGNGRCGIAIKSATGTIVGGTEEGARNVVSGNFNDGIEIIGETTTGTRVQGNYVGTDVTGTQDLGNGGSGVDVSGAKDNLIGGTEAGEGNLLSGNGSSGVEIRGETATGNTVQGNRVGTDATGTKALGNDDLGVYIVNAHDNTIGGTEEGAGNLLSGNGADGIQIREEASGNVVQGNLAGTDVSGTKALGNGLTGIAIGINAHDNTVGGTAEGARNVVSGNREDGILFTEAAYGNEVKGNFVGTDETGEADLGNARYGIVALASARDNTIGGTEPGESNVVAYNDAVGIRISGEGTTGNTILRNSIYANGGLGIDLNNDGVTANDEKDADKGPNNLQNYPVLESKTSTTVKGKLNSTPKTKFTILFFSSPEADSSGHGEGKTYLGQKQVKTGRKGNAKVKFKTEALDTGVVTAIAIDPEGNTSEFSEAVEMGTG